MANYYVSANRGSNSTGTGSATNPWKTIGKAIGPSPAITLSGSGDTLYIEPGVYREVVTLSLAPTSGGPLKIVGDGDGAGFVAGGYATPATGVVDWRGWSDETTAITTAELLVATAVSYVTVQGVKFTNGNGGQSGILLNGVWSNWTIQDCIFVGNASKPYAVWALGVAGSPFNLTVRRCTFFTNRSGMGVQITAPTHTAEYSVNVLVENCRFLGCSAGVRLTPSGAASFNPTGVRVQHCDFFLSLTGVVSQLSAAINNTTPLYVYGCRFFHVDICISANANATHFIEDGNAFFSSNPRSASVTAGTNSKTNPCLAVEVDDGRLYGVPLRPLGSPMPGSVFVGAGAYGTPPSDDVTGRARPEGTGSTSASIGAIERHDTGVKDVVRQDAGSPACLALVGPSSQERPILVNPQSTTLSIKVRWDGNHGDAAKPQAMLLASPEIGVAAQTITAASTGGSGASPNGYETLTFAPITPTAAGVVMLRMVSRAAAGNGAAYFDTITLS